MGSMHAQAYLKIKDATLVAVVDARRGAALAALRKIGIALPVHVTLAEALAAQRVDAVDICAPTFVHAPLVREALAQGKHVFCEKPFVPTAKEGFALAAAAKKAGLMLQVGQCLRFWPEYVAFTDFVRSERAGRLLSLSLQRRAGRPGYSAGNWLNDGEASGGAALDLHIHDTDYVQHLLGVPNAVTSVGTRDATGWSHIFTTYHFKDIAVTAEGGWNYPAQWGFQMAFQAVFERGTVEFDSTRSPVLVFGDAKGKKKPLPFEEPAVGRSSSGVGNVSSLGGYFVELAYFVDCLEKGRPPEIATGEQASESVRIVEAEIRSAKTGRTVTL